MTRTASARHAACGQGFRTSPVLLALPGGLLEEERSETKCARAARALRAARTRRASCARGRARNLSRC